jgi:hypothetical protein
MVSYAHVPGVSEKMGSGIESLGLGRLLVEVEDAAMVKKEALEARDEGLVVQVQVQAVTVGASTRKPRKDVSIFVTTVSSSTIGRRDNILYSVLGPKLT